MDTDLLREALEQRMGELLAQPCSVTELVRLTSGASRETWIMGVHPQTGEFRELVLRRDPPADEDPARMALEAAAFVEAAKQNVPVPALLDDSNRSDVDGIDGIGNAYILMEKIPGDALPQRLLRDDRFAEVRRRLPHELGRILARIHRMDPDALPGLAGGDQVENLFETYTATGLPVPILEVAFAWLRAHRPSTTRETVVHGDFRNGNLLVDENGVRAVLDWELVHRGDPMEDLGWLCAKAWRFGSAEPVGGFGSREDLFRGYEEESGIAPDPHAVQWWEVYSTLRWAVICRIQANRGASPGESEPLELLAIGRRVAECEKDLLVALTRDGAQPPLEAGTDADDPFGSPSVEDLLGAVREFVRSRSEDADPRSKYLGKVACNVLDIAARE